VVGVIRSHGDGAERTRPSGDRGQVVLVAAAVVAVALLSMTVAYAQLGYDADRRGAGARVAPVSEIDQGLTGSLRTAAREARHRTDDRSWRDHRAVARRVTESLRSDIDRLERAHAAERRSLSIELQDTAATQWARSRCPDARGRDFGPCRTIGGIVLQKRAGETVVVAAAFRIRIVSPAESTTLTTVSRTVPRPDPGSSGDGGVRGRPLAAVLISHK
jgi:hypothetical protein